jgi:aminopeptidase
MSREASEVFDVESLAEQTMQMLSVSPGQVIWIWTSTHSLDLLEGLAYRIRARGAFWTVRLTMEPLLRRIGQGVPEPYLGLVPEHELRWLDDVDAIVEVRDHSGHIPDVLTTRRRAMAAEWIALIEEASRRNCRRIVVVHPTQALASAYSVPLAPLRQRYRQAVDIDYEALDRRQGQVRALLAGSTAVRIVSALGTNLELRIGGRPVYLDMDTLPRGEVYVAPYEDSANGVVVVDRAFIRGQPVERLRLAFASGRVVDISAPDLAGADRLREMLAASSGDKDVIAEFGIGLNPGATAPVGDVMLDEKIGGSVHVAIGMNERFGGRNRSNLHLDLVVLRPTVWLDETRVIENGILSESAMNRWRPQPRHAEG